MGLVPCSVGLLSVADMSRLIVKNLPNGVSLSAAFVWQRSGLRERDETDGCCDERGLGEERCLTGRPHGAKSRWRSWGSGRFPRWFLAHWEEGLLDGGARKGLGAGPLVLMGCGGALGPCGAAKSCPGDGVLCMRYALSSVGQSRGTPQLLPSPCLCPQDTSSSF